MLPITPASSVSASTSVVIINYNTRTALRACLNSLQSQPAAKVLVVDNASSDGSAEMVCAEFPWVTLCANSQNLGYGAAANLGIAQCYTHYVLLLNSDTQLQAGTLDSLARYLDHHPSVGIAGARIVNPDGTPQTSCFPFPTPQRILLAENMFGVLLQRIPFLREQYLYGWSPGSAQRVSWVLGAALAIRRAAFTSVGGFDESYFMYFEETDLCYRLRAAGWETHFVPDATIVHIGGASTVQVRATMQVALYKSLMHFYSKHYSRWRRMQLRLLLSYLMLRNLMLDRIRLTQSTETDKARLVENRVVWRQILSELWRSESFDLRENTSALQRGIVNSV